MALLTVNKAKVTGQAVAYVAAAAGGDTFPRNSAFQELRVKNGSASPVTATLVIPGSTPEGQPWPDIPVAVAAGAETAILVPASAVDSSTGLCSVTYSAVTSVTVAAVSMA